MKGIVSRIIGFTNELPQGGVRRVLVVPFGEFPHPDGPTQAVNAATAGKIVAAIRRAISAGKAALPIYQGHPDDGEDIPDDSNVYGSIIDAEVRPASVAFSCEFKPEGIALVRNGKRFFSPHWLANVARNIAYPFELLSIGLTDRPVIPVAAIANQNSSAAGGGKGESQMRDKLMAMLKKHGIECPADATDEQLQNLVDSTIGKVSTLGNELAAEKAQVTNLQGTVNTQKTELATAKTDTATAVTALANERKLRRDLLLDVALSDGRVPPVARKQWEGEFDKDFDGTVTKLANAQKVVKTTPVATGLAGRDAAGSSNVSRIVALVNEERKKTGCDHHTAHMRVKESNPELFGAQGK